jgi:hypothetical protein
MNQGKSKSERISKNKETSRKSRKYRKIMKKITKSQRKKITKIKGKLKINKILYNLDS